MPYENKTWNGRLWMDEANLNRPIVEQKWRLLSLPG